MLAGHRLEDHFGIGILPREIAIDAQPMHLAALVDLVGADNGDIVLALAGHHTGVTAGTGIQVDRHTPCVPVVGRLLPKRFQRIMVSRVGEGKSTWHFIGPLGRANARSPRIRSTSPALNR